MAEEVAELKEPMALKVFYIIFSILMIIFSILLIIVYLKDKKNHLSNNSSEKMKLYLCYLNILFCSVVITNNVMRLIPESLTADYYGEQADINDKKYSPLCKIQAFSVSLLDKLLLSLITIYSLNHYLSVFHIDYYKQNMKKICILLPLSGFLLSLVLTIIFLLDGISLKDVLCYIHTRTLVKKLFDNIYTSLLFLVNIICLTRLLINLNDLKKKYGENGNQIMLKKSQGFIKRFIINLILNIFSFLYIFLLINKVFPRGNYKDLIYILICLIVELFFTFNEYLFKAFVRLITCNKYYNDADRMLGDAEQGTTDGYTDDNPEEI
jgi:hypothetical protein